MTPTTFRAIHEASGMTSAELARFLRLEDARSIRRYRSGETAVSGPVHQLMLMLSSGCLKVSGEGVVYSFTSTGTSAGFHSIMDKPND